MKAGPLRKPDATARLLGRAPAASHAPLLKAKLTRAKLTQATLSKADWIAIGSIGET
jgi:uncharacterized protein YjbI with pentapeptide repeats